MADMIPAIRIVAVVTARVQSAHTSIKAALPPSYDRKGHDEALAALSVALELLSLINSPVVAQAPKVEPATPTLDDQKSDFSPPATLAADVQPAFEASIGLDVI